MTRFRHVLSVPSDMGKSENAPSVTNCSKWSIHLSHIVVPPPFRLHFTNTHPAAIIVGSVSMTIESFMVRKGKQS